MTIFLLFLAPVAVVLCALGLFVLFRRRVPRLTDSDLLSILEGILQRPGTSLHVVTKLSTEERKDVKDAFLSGLDFRWMTVGGDGRGKELTESPAKEQHKAITYYLVECMIGFSELYGHVIVCRDDSTNRFLGSICLVPPYNSFSLYNMHFLRSVIPLGRPIPHKINPGTRARFDAFGESVGKEKAILMANGPHWYVATIGVAVQGQGKGVGRLLMETAKTISGTLPFYLECNDGNVPFYEKMGMRRARQITLSPKVSGSTVDATDFPFNVMLSTPPVDDR